MDFGAAGDYDPSTGLGTDDTIAFQNALNSSAAVRVYVPNGSYKITSTIDMGLYKTLVGESREGTILYFDSPDPYAILGDAFSQLENIYIWNKTSPLGTKTGVASYTPTTGNGWRNGLMRNVRIRDFHVGIGSTQGLTQGLMFDNIYEHVRIDNANTAVQIGSGSNNNLFSVCEFWFCNTVFHFNNATTQNIQNCAFEFSNTRDFLVETSNNINFDNCYFEPARSSIFDDSTGTFTNCHSTNFATTSTVFLTARNNSTVSINDFTDFNYNGIVTTGQSYYAVDGTSVVYGLNLTTRGGAIKINPRSTDGVILSQTKVGDWYVTRWGNGWMTMDMNTEITGTIAPIMTGTTASYSATLTLPTAFLDNDFIVTPSICANAAAGFLLIESPRIAARAKTSTTVDVVAARTYSSFIDGYFYSLQLAGRWK
jgi:hypothetical protein